MRPILLAMTNPHSDDPARALWPDPPGCTGWRTWKMVYDVTRMSKEQYIEAFDRRNLLIGAWSKHQAAVAGSKFISNLGQGQVVVVLGEQVWSALGLGEVAPGRCVRVDGSTLYYTPHPSGLCRYYNDSLNRWSLGRLLADLAAAAEERTEASWMAAWEGEDAR